MEADEAEHDSGPGRKNGVSMWSLVVSFLVVINVTQTHPTSPPESSLQRVFKKPSQVHNSPVFWIQSKTSITFFPPEILLIIFEFVHSESSYIMPSATDPAWFSNPALTFRSLFPRAICSSWHGVMAMAPEFWSNLVLVVDIDKPFSLLDI